MCVEGVRPDGGPMFSAVRTEVGYAWEEGGPVRAEVAHEKGSFLLFFLFSFFFFLFHFQISIWI
jgi:hypothetical protein